MKNKNVVIISLVSLFAVVLFFYLIASRSTSIDQTADEISLVKSGNELKVDRSGLVTYKTSDGTFSDFWNKEKTDAFFNYFENNYTGESQTLYTSSDQVVISRGGVNYTYSSSNDELTDAAIEDSQTPDTNPEDNNTGDGVTQYFSPTPTPQASGQPTQTPVPTSTSSGGFSDTCLFWKLSYCVIARTPTPVPTTTATPDPNANVIQVNNCGEYISEGNNTPVIISNTVCIPDNN